MIEFTMVRGTKRTFTMLVTKRDLSPVDLTTFDITFTVKRSYTTPVVIEKTVGAGIIKSNTITNQCTVTLDPVDTRTVALERKERLLWDLEIRAAGDNQVPLSGTLTVTPDVTRSGE